jgi:hypothetical protein
VMRMCDGARERAHAVCCSRRRPRAPAR